jgi:hypothetical protein
MAGRKEVSASLDQGDRRPSASLRLGRGKVQRATVRHPRNTEPVRKHPATLDGEAHDGPKKCDDFADAG